MLIVIAFILVTMLAIAVLCARRLTGPSVKPIADVSPMKATLERRIREGREFRL